MGVTPDTPRSAETTGARSRPMTGAEYVESRHDGREAYIYGERVKDVTQPAFRNAVRMTARLYDALHHPERKDVLTAPTDTGSGGYTHSFFRAARSAEDIRPGGLDGPRPGGVRRPQRGPERPAQPGRSPVTLHISRRSPHYLQRVAPLSGDQVRGHRRFP